MTGPQTGNGGLWALHSSSETRGADAVHLGACVSFSTLTGPGGCAGMVRAGVTPRTGGVRVPVGIGRGAEVQCGCGHPQHTTER